MTEYFSVYFLRGGSTHRNGPFVTRDAEGRQRVRDVIVKDILEFGGYRFKGKSEDKGKWTQVTTREEAERISQEAYIWICPFRGSGPGENIPPCDFGTPIPTIEAHVGTYVCWWAGDKWSARVAKIAAWGRPMVVDVNGPVLSDWVVPVADLRIWALVDKACTKILFEGTLSEVAAKIHAYPKGTWDVRVKQSLLIEHSQLLQGVVATSALKTSQGDFVTEG